MPPAEHIGGKVQMADVREENFKTGNYRCTNHEIPAPLVQSLGARGFHDLTRFYRTLM